MDEDEQCGARILKQWHQQWEGKAPGALRDPCSRHGAEAKQRLQEGMHDLGLADKWEQCLEAGIWMRWCEGHPGRDADGGKPKYAEYGYLDCPCPGKKAPWRGTCQGELYGCPCQWDYCECGVRAVASQLKRVLMATETTLLRGGGVECACCLEARKLAMDAAGCQWVTHEGEVEVRGVVSALMGLLAAARPTQPTLLAAVCFISAVWRLARWVQWQRQRGDRAKGCSLPGACFACGLAGSGVVWGRIVPPKPHQMKACCSPCWRTADSGAGLGGDGGARKIGHMPRVALGG